MQTLLEVGLSNAVMAALLALVAAVLACCCRRPALAHRLWLLVLLKLVTPPLVGVPVPWPPPGEPAGAGGILSSAADRPARPGPAQPSGVPGAGAREVRLSTLSAVLGEERLPPLAGKKEALREAEGRVQTEAAAPPGALASWGKYFVPLSLAGSVLWFARAGLHVCRFRRLLPHVRPAPDDLREQARRLAARMGLRRCPPVWLVPGAVSPLVWAVGQAPCVLFPAGLLGLLDGERRAALLAHELAHVRRRDHWVRLLELVVTGVYWWHPVVWWARREMHEAEEQCCDAWVVWALAGAQGAYARALLQTAAFVAQARPAVPVAASGVGPVAHLRRRLTMIMQGRTAPSLSWAGCLAVLGLGLLVLPLLPLWGQQPAQEQSPQAPAAKDPREQQIEALRAAIKIIEEQKRAEAAKQGVVGTKGIDLAALEKARAEAADLARHVEVKRRELQALEARYKEACDRVARLQGRTAEGERRELQLFAVPFRSPRGGDTMWVTRPAQGVLQLGVAPPAAPPADSKTAELEQKLNRVLKEVEELRREVRRQHPQAGPGTGIPVNPYAPAGATPSAQETAPDNPLIRWGLAAPAQPKKPGPQGTPAVR
jgi:beta-lactamase regulating signal transducer with metallopeptidase domain